MFGFTQSPTTCCKTASHSIYKSHFCGLSCRLKKDYGHTARFLVNRDSTFLTLLGSSLTQQPYHCELSTCCNPLAQPTPLLIDSSVQSYSAAVAVCGLSAKCADDIEDHGVFRSTLAKTASALTNKWKDRAISTLNSFHFPTQQTLGHLNSQWRNEFPHSTVAEAASATALAYQNIFSHLSNILPVKAHEPLATVGFNLGQLVYICDAVDDIEKDTKRDQYNPLRYRPIAELVDLANTASAQFHQAINSLPILRHQETIGSVLTQTDAFHQDLLTSPTPSSKRKKKKERDETNSCLECCGDGCDCLTDCECSIRRFGCNCCDCCSCD